MAVKIRLARRGRKKRAMYDVVVADARAPRDGRFIEKIGTYNPNTDPASITLNEDKAFDWVMKGAQPTDTARAILSYRGVMIKKHLQVGVLKGAITQEEADKRHAEWLKDKELKIQGKIDRLAKDKAEAEKSRLDAESKVNKARQEEIQKKRIADDQALAAKVAEANADEAEQTLEAEGQEAVAELEAQETAEAAETTSEGEKAETTEEVKQEEDVAEAPAEKAATKEEATEEAAKDEAAEKAPKTETAEETPKDEPAEEAPKAEAAEEAPAEEEAKADTSESEADEKAEEDSKKEDPKAE